MKAPYFLDIFQNQKTERYKVLIWGQADGHVTDWQGCNFRTTPVGQQPLRGFRLIEEARALKQTLEANPDRFALEKNLAKQTGGSFLGDNTLWQMVSQRD